MSTAMGLTTRAKEKKKKKNKKKTNEHQSRDSNRDREQLHNVKSDSFKICYSGDFSGSSGILVVCFSGVIGVLGCFTSIGCIM